MAIQTITYGTKTAITMTSLNSLASTSACQSSAVDNTVNKFDDAVIQVALAAGTTNLGAIDFYVASSLSDSTYADGATGTDGTFTATSRKNSIWIGNVQVSASIASVSTFQRSVASCFNGVMPSKWTLIAINNSGVGLAASGHVVSYMGITYTLT